VLTNNLMIAAALLTKRSINDPIVAPFVRARRSTFPLTDQRMLIAAVEKARGNAYRPSNIVPWHFLRERYGAVM
jgi:hypothetical protein